MRALPDTSVLIGDTAPDRIEATFDPLPLTSQIAREWRRLAAAVTERGGIISDLVDAHTPSQPRPDQAHGGSAPELR